MVASIMVRPVMMAMPRIQMIVRMTVRSRSAVTACATFCEKAVMTGTLRPVMAVMHNAIWSAVAMAETTLAKPAMTVISMLVMAVI